MMVRKLQVKNDGQKITGKKVTSHFVTVTIRR